MTSKTSHHLQHPDRAARASFAKNTINYVIPRILQHNPRAKAGNESTERIYYSPETANDRAKQTSSFDNDSQDNKKTDLGKITGHFKPLTSKKHVTPSQGHRHDESLMTTEAVDKTGKETADNEDKEIANRMGSSSSSIGPKPKITVIQSDTLDAAHLFVNPATTNRRISVLNMASFLRPGGGVINGAIAQEESLCLRSTLYTALDEKFYRLPKFGGLFTRDVLVFRDSNNQDLPKAEWYYVDVISVAALKRPDVVKTKDGKELYEYEQDRDEMISKIKLILKTAVKNKTTYLILGALGCGAYHNPPEEVAKMFRKVIFGNSRGQWAMDLAGIEEIVFAIFDDGVNLQVFKEFLADSPSLSSVAGGKVSDGGDSCKAVGSADVAMVNA